MNVDDLNRLLRGEQPVFSQPIQRLPPIYPTQCKKNHALIEYHGSACPMCALQAEERLSHSSQDSSSDVSRGRNAGG